MFESDLFWTVLREGSVYLISVLFLWAFFLLFILPIVLILEAFRWAKERILLPQRSLDMVILKVLYTCDGDPVDSLMLYKHVCREVNMRLTPVRVYRRFAALRQCEWIRGWRVRDERSILYTITQQGIRVMDQLHEAAIAPYDRSPFASIKATLK